MFDKKTYRLLKSLYRHETLSEEEVNKITYTPAPGHGNKHISFLMENKMIEICYKSSAPDDAGGYFDGITSYRITLPGRAFVEQRRRDFWGFFIPYAITTFIALLSLIGFIAANWKTIMLWFQ